MNEYIKAMNRYRVSENRVGNTGQHRSVFWLHGKVKFEMKPNGDHVITSGKTEWYTFHPDNSVTLTGQCKSLDRMRLLLGLDHAHLRDAVNLTVWRKDGYYVVSRHHDGPTDTRLYNWRSMSRVMLTDGSPHESMRPVKPLKRWIADTDRLNAIAKTTTYGDFVPWANAKLALTGVENTPTKRHALSAWEYAKLTTDGKENLLWQWTDRKNWGGLLGLYGFGACEVYRKLLRDVHQTIMSAPVDPTGTAWTQYTSIQRGERLYRDVMKAKPPAV